jgi:hypothetical protein
MKSIYIRLFALVFSLGLINHSNAQIPVPYTNNFDNIGDTVGWAHHAISGTDDWVRGQPNKISFTVAYTWPNVWVSNLTGNAAANSNRELRTPAFNLSDLTKHYAFSFYHQRKNQSTLGYYIEYSINNGQTWQILYSPTAKSKNWQSSGGFNSAFYNSFQYSAYELYALQGQNNVMFRFRHVTGVTAGEGWMIDNFSIAEDYTNVFSDAEDTIRISTNCTSINPVTTLGLDNQYQKSYNIVTNCYISSDTILDASDILLGSKTTFTSSTNTNWYASFPVPAGLTAGQYFFLYQFDATNVVPEINENDNVGYDVLFIDPVFPVPFHDDLENSPVPWTTVLGSNATMLVWEKGKGYFHHLEDAHSGTNAWHTSKSNSFNFSGCGTTCNTQYVVSPFIDLASGNGSNVINFWFKRDMELADRSLEYSSNCGLNWSNLTYIYENRNDEWDYRNVSLNQLSASNNIQFRFKYSATYIRSEGMIFDDVYVGPPKPDLSVEGDVINRFGHSAQTVDTIKYRVCNSGLIAAPASQTAFFWSTDSILDASDQYLGSKQEAMLADTAMEWRYFGYTRPTAVAGTYYIFYLLDSTNTIDEMRESNNTGYFRVSLENSQAYPYFNDFESDIDGWKHNASLGTDSWRWGQAAGNVLNTAFSGTKAFISNTTGAVPSMSRMHLYSPVIDLSSSTHPVISFDMKMHCDGLCHCFEAKTNMSYSMDGGATWLLLDTTNQSFNYWYYPLEYEDYDGKDYMYQQPSNTILLFKPVEWTFADGSSYNGRDTRRNTRYVLDVPFLAGNANVRFRFNTGTLKNASLPIPFEGALLDNFRISEASTDFVLDEVKPLMISSLSHQIKFAMNIYNQGNYYGEPTTVNYFLSADTLIDASDSLIGQYAVPRIKPDKYYYLSADCNAPANLPDFKYLLYQLDAGNVVAEPNELNNTGYWPLALDSIKTYPYFMDFNDTLVPGWSAYVKPYNASSIAGGFRFRNMKAPGEWTYQSDIQSGEMFTDRINDQSWIKPVWYLETPAFDFEHFDTIYMSFDLACTGRISDPLDGGNLEYSIDGGNTFSLLTAQAGQAFNWYSHYLTGFFSQMGWSGPPAGYAVCELDSTSFDLSFLKGQRHVVLRYKYYSNWLFWGGGTVQGMRIDNFRMQAYTVDYAANDFMVPVSANLIQTSISLPYSITNLGQSQGRNTYTRFYWSADNVLDAGDQLVLSKPESPVHSGNTLAETAVFTLPQPIQQGTYYVFYKTDADSNLMELNENNNFGSYIINFPTQANYYANIQGDTVHATVFQPSFQVIYSIVNNGNVSGLSTSTSFFWSTDSIMDLADVNVLDVAETAIAATDTTTSTVSITYPDSLTQPLYYLFYKADQDNAIAEILETDNLGFFRVLTDYNSGIGTSQFPEMIVAVANGVLYITNVPVFGQEITPVRLLNAIGQEVYHADVRLLPGFNKINLPELVRGIYFVVLDGRHIRTVRKVQITKLNTLH